MTCSACSWGRTPIVHGRHRLRLWSAWPDQGQVLVGASLGLDAIGSVVGGIRCHASMRHPCLYCDLWSYAAMLALWKRRAGRLYVGHKFRMGWSCDRRRTIGWVGGRAGTCWCLPLLYARSTDNFQQPTTRLQCCSGLRYKRIGTTMFSMYDGIIDAASLA